MNVMIEVLTITAITMVMSSHGGDQAVVPVRVMGRIISLSSWSRMWQCQTYPGPTVASKGKSEPSWLVKRILITVTWSLYAMIVSFQPCSFGGGSMGSPVK